MYDSKLKLFDCTVAPTDIRPIVDVVLSEQELLAINLDSTKKIVIVVGEVHNFQSHLILQMLLVREMYKRYGRGLAVGFEIPSNILKLLEGGFFKRSPHTAADVFNTAVIRGSAEARKHLLKICMDLGLSWSFNDMEARLQGRKVLINADIAERNLNIVKNTVRHIQRTNARVYIQTCGISHLWGVSDLDSFKQKKRGFLKTKKAESLSELYRKEGFQVLPLILEYEAKEFENEDLSDVLKVQGLAPMYDDRFSFRVVCQRLNQAYDLCL